MHYSGVPAPSLQRCPCPPRCLSELHPQRGHGRVWSPDAFLLDCTAICQNLNELPTLKKLKNYHPSPPPHQMYIFSFFKNSTWDHLVSPAHIQSCPDRLELSEGHSCLRGTYSVHSLMLLIVLLGDLPGPRL